MAIIDVSSSGASPGSGADEIRAASLSEKLLAAVIAAVAILVVAGMMITTI